MAPSPINKPLMQCYPEVADDDEEVLLADVRKHWLGRVAIIVTGGILILLILLFTAFAPSLAGSIDTTISTGGKAILFMIGLFLSVLVAIGTLINLWVYNKSHLLITNQNVIELKQMSLFSNKISHLNMINVEDVSVTKKGILQTFFDYGVLSIETAGQKDNFSFPNTPDPDDYRRMVISAHEDAIENVGHMGPVQRVEISDNGL